jgi:membrane carboxypeptidase/penicillin-binding protein PbpC
MLDAITVVSAKDAWAVGYTGTYAIDRTLLLHWNGEAWS